MIASIADIRLGLQKATKMYKPSTTHGQYDARPTVTFQVAGHRCLATGILLYDDTGTWCEQLAQGSYL